MEAMQTSDDTWPSDVAEALSHLTAGHNLASLTCYSQKSPMSSAKNGKIALQERATKYYWH